MPHRRTRLNWIYDNDLQQFTTPSGQVVTLLQIAQLMQDQVNCRHDFVGPWTGWRIRQNRLIPPNKTYRSSQITPENLRAFSRWLASFEQSQYQLPLGTNPPEPARPDRTDTASHERTAPLVVPPEQSSPEQRRDGPRPRAKVVQLADYRRRVRAR
jgi:hypothetical protein